MTFFKKSKNERLNSNKDPSLSCTSSKYSNSQYKSSDFLQMFEGVSSHDTAFYQSIRQSIPIIDAAISKIIRLVGGFSISCGDHRVDKKLEEFINTVRVGPSSFGLESFTCSFLDSLLTFGNAVGEIILSNDMSYVAGLYNADINSIVVKTSSSPIETSFFIKNNDLSISKAKFPNLICFCALNPPPSKTYGVSLLQNLPFVSSILLKIYSSIGKNFDRMGNIRFAVSYNSPDGQTTYSRDRMNLIAKEWASVMSSSDSSQVKDFITNGNVDIKVIGADSQILDSNIPVRQMLEQIIAKLSIPPFLLGLNWSTSERMSKQQADILTSELAYYRRLLSPVIMKIVNTFLHLQGIDLIPTITWSNINLQDEIEFARARLYNAQAINLENQILKL